MDSFKLVDSRKRCLDYLRISVTDRCNLRCIYCAPTGQIHKVSHSDIMTYEEILRIVSVGVSLGIKKVRVTGGEPLTRKGICNFIRNLASIDGLVDLSVTTNGVLLSSMAKRLNKAGISRINVSLDSLKSEKYKYITKHDEFERVWSGIMLAYELGFNPIKINVVAMKGLNDDEIFDFAKLSFLYPFHIRFIEYMPMGNNQIKEEYQILTPEIKKKLLTLGNLRSIKNEENDGPARRFKFDGAVGELGFISALSHHFCDKCNRLRLTASGELRSCLLSDSSTSLKKTMRGGCSDDMLCDIFLTSARNKVAKHYISPNSMQIVNGQMYDIGG